MSEENKNLIIAVSQKAKEVINRFQNLKTNTKPRVPNKLMWIITGKHIPNSVCCLDNLSYSISDIPLDKLARTFCALEDFEGWLEKVENGIKKHQAEMEKQANTKICRLKTFAVFSNFNNNNNNNETDIPF